MSLTITRMLDADINQIIEIQSENQRQNLSPSQLQHGYLSIAFSEDEFKDFNDNLCVVVVKEHDEVIGYCCVSSAAFNAQFPILDQIVAGISSYVIPETQDIPTEGKSCIYGPVCIAHSHRGKGVLEKLSIFGLEIAKEKGFNGLKKVGLEKIVTCIEGDALKTLPTLEGKFDFVFIDAVKKDFVSNVLVTKLDLTDDYTRAQSLLLAGWLGIRDVVAANWGKTGFMLLIDVDSKEVVGKVTKKHTEDEIKDAIKKALVHKAG